MKKVILIVVALITVAACTPEEVMLIRTNGHGGTITEDDVKAAEGWNVAESQGGEFLSAAAALHNDPFLTCTRAHESDTAGGYQAYNPAGPAYGAYQFLRDTWDKTALHAGLIFLIGTDILSVNSFWQDVMAMHLYLWQGKAPWLYLC